MSATAEQELLRTFFDKKCHGTITEPNQCVLLKEDGKQATLRRLTLSHLGKHGLVLHLEVGQGNDRRYSPLIAKIEDWSMHRACDALIYFEYKGQPYEIFIELKSGDTVGCQAQIQASIHFMDYAWSILEWQQGHQRIKRRRRLVVFNTKKTAAQTINKRRMHPRHQVTDDVIYLKVANGDVITPDRFC